MEQRNRTNRKINKSEEKIQEEEKKQLSTNRREKERM